METLVESHNLLRRAREYERHDSWNEASQLYRRAIRVSKKSPQILRETAPKAARASENAAYQAGTYEAYRSILKGAVEGYRLAADAYGKSRDQESIFRKLVYKGSEDLAGYWLAETPRGRKDSVQRAISRFRSAIKVDRMVHEQEHLKTAVSLAECLILNESLELEWTHRRKLVKEAASMTQRIITPGALDAVSSDRLRACITGVQLGVLTRDGTASGMPASLLETSSATLSNILNLAPQIDRRLLCRARLWNGIAKRDLSSDLDASAAELEIARDLATQIQDRPLLVYTLQELIRNHLIQITDQDLHFDRIGRSEKVRALAQEGLAAASPLHRHDLMSSMHLYGFCENNVKTVLSGFMEEDRARNMLIEANESGQLGIDFARNHGLWRNLYYGLGLRAVTLLQLSLLNGTADEKIDMLEVARDSLDEAIKQYSRIYPSTTADLAILQIYSATTFLLLHLNGSKTDPYTYLNEASLQSTNALKSLVKAQQIDQETGDFVQAFDMLSRSIILVFRDAQQEWFPRGVIDAYSQISAWLRKDDNVRVSVSKWLSGAIQSHLGNIERAREDFETANDLQFRIKGKASVWEGQIPQVGAFYEIEQAKLKSLSHDHNSAALSYDKAAAAFPATKIASTLKNYYYARAEIEKALGEYHAGMHDEGDLSLSGRLAGLAHRSSGRPKQEQFIEEVYWITRTMLALNKIEGSDRSSASSDDIQNNLEGLRKVNLSGNNPRLEYLIELFQIWHSTTLSKLADDFKSLVTSSQMLVKLGDQWFANNEERRSILYAIADLCQGLGACATPGGSIEQSVKESRKFFKSASDHFSESGYSKGSKLSLALDDISKISLRISEEEAARLELGVRIQDLRDRDWLAPQENAPEESYSDFRKIFSGLMKDLRFAPMFLYALHPSSYFCAKETPHLPEAMRGATVVKLKFPEGNLEPRKEVKIRVEIVNFGWMPVKVTSLDGILGPWAEFVYMKDADVNGEILKCAITVMPFKKTDAELTVRPVVTGIQNLRVMAEGENGLGDVFYESATSTVVIGNVEQFDNQDRMSTGNSELDRLLGGGIVPKYAIALSAPNCNEERRILKDLIDKGIHDTDPVIVVTGDSSHILTEISNMSIDLIICNPRLGNLAASVKNLQRLKGVENLSDIGIAISEATTRAPNPNSNKLIVIDVMSEILLTHKALNARKWLSDQFARLKLDGWTIWASINPYMHQSEDVETILGLFDGEIRIFEKESDRYGGMYIKIRKMYSQKYSDSEMPTSSLMI